MKVAACKERVNSMLSSARVRGGNERGIFDDVGINYLHS